MASGQKWVIAHRGASGYLPENTLPAFAMAHGLGCDWIELDVILSQDDQPIVLHDLSGSIDGRESVFPWKAATRQPQLCTGFILGRTRQLRVSERRDQQGIQLFLDATSRPFPL